MDEKKQKMNPQTRQIISSVLAIVCCAAFLWVGKHYIWNNAVVTEQPDSLSSEDFTPGTTLGWDIPSSTEPGQTAGTGETQSTSADGSSLTQLTDTQPTGSNVSTVSTASTFSTASTASAASTVSTAATTLTQTQSSTASTASKASTASTASTASSTASTASTSSGGGSSSGLTVAGFSPAPAGYFNDALFIGDSRYVGVGTYSKPKNLLSGSLWYASTGLASYNITKKSSDVDFKGQTFAAALSSKTFTKVYISLGINELGNNASATANKFAELISQIHTAQPTARIYVCANLHVTANPKTKYTSLVTNDNINKLNSALKALCNGSSIVYLDVNPYFDDANGRLRTDVTSDGIHPTAKYYLEWAQWLEANVIL